jgi:hypothetical protein
MTDERLAALEKLAAAARRLRAAHQAVPTYCRGADGRAHHSRSAHHSRGLHIIRAVVELDDGHELHGHP